MVSQLLLLASLSVAVTGSDVIGTYGNSVTIDCSLPLSDSLVWDSTDGNVIAIKGRLVVRNSTKYAIERQNGVRESLVIHQLTLADDKVYRCYDLRQTDIKELSTVTVLVRPHYMNMTSPTGPVNEGSEVSLQCQADGGKPLPDIRWYMLDAAGNVMEMIGVTADTTYSNGTGQRTNTLTFNVTKNHYNATFVCNISVSVFFEETFVASLDVQLLPGLPSISGFDGIYDQNETVHVACTSTGSRPTANIMWFLNGRPVGDFEVVVIPEADGTSTVTSYFRRRLSPSMNGTILTCAVTNSVLTDLKRDSFKSNVTLLISYRPNITIESNGVITAISGDFVTFLFHVDSRPAPFSVDLLHNSVRLDRSFFKIDHQNDSNRYEVIIPGVSRFLAGNYSISATNRLGTSVSSAVQLRILYTPQCTSSDVQKQAIRVNNSVHLLCRMNASPSDVTLTWRYRHTKTVISTITASKDNSSKEQVYGDVELDASSLLQYTDTYVECYGTNSVGVSVDPCVFQLVHPGPPEAPSNCTISHLHMVAYFICQPSFDGGSTQAFAMQRLIGSNYQTIFNQSTPEFNILAFGLVGNVTVRMCSVNEEFPDQFSCTQPFEADVGGTMSEPSKAESFNTAAYIAGGIVAFIGLLCISSIIIFILRKKQKNIKSSQDNPTTYKVRVSRMREIILECLFKERTRENNNIQLDRMRRTDENIVANNENEIKEVKVISSTPCFTKQHRINAINVDAAEILQQFESLRKERAWEIKPSHCTDITYANGVILSPIVKRQEDDEDLTGIETFEMQESNNKTTGDTVENQDIIVTINEQTLKNNKYSKADIADVLDEESHAKHYSRTDIADVLDSTELEISTVSNIEEMHTDIASLMPDPEVNFNGTLSLNTDYSAADIVSVLDRINTEDSNSNHLDCSTSVVPDMSVEIVDETSFFQFSECDTALGLSRTFSFMNDRRKTKLYMAHSISSPDLTRADVLFSDVSSKSCSSLYCISGENLVVRRLSDSDIQNVSATSLNSTNHDQQQISVLHTSLESVIDNIGDSATVKEITTTEEQATCIKEVTTIW